MIEMMNINMMATLPIMMMIEDFTFIMMEHKYDGDFTFIMIEMRNINMMLTLPI